LLEGLKPKNAKTRSGEGILNLAGISRCSMDCATYENSRSLILLQLLDDYLLDLWHPDLIGHPGRVGVGGLIHLHVMQRTKRYLNKDIHL
jgi:hypothetical protein